MKTQLVELDNMIWTYPDFVHWCADLYKHLDTKMGIGKVLAHTTAGSPAARTVCNDLVNRYNSDDGERCRDIYASSFRSKDQKDRSKYLKHLYKDFTKVLQMKYAHNIILSGMEMKEIMDGLRLFLEQVR